MKLHCAKCNKQLTHDLYKVSVSRLNGIVLNINDIWHKDTECDYPRSDMKSGLLRNKATSATLYTKVLTQLDIRGNM